MVAPKEKLHTLDDFERFLARPENADRLFELVNREMVEKAPTQRHGVIAVNISAELRHYVKQRGSGRVAVEVRHQFPGDLHNARLPDVCYDADSSQPSVNQGAVFHMPDLAVEIQSPGESYRALREKADYYLAHGARMVGLIYPDKHLVEVQTADDFDVFTGGAIDGGELLPGFSLPLDDIFAD